MSLSNYTAAIDSLAKEHFDTVSDDNRGPLMDSISCCCWLLDANSQSLVLEHSDNDQEYFDIFDDDQILERIKENGFNAELETQAFHAMSVDVEMAINHLNKVKG